MATRVISTERARGCGYRSAGKRGYGIYLMGPDTSLPCGRLPFPLRSCPCCGGGIKPARAWTWIEPSTLFAPNVEPQCDTTKILARYPNNSNAPAQICGKCPMGGALPDGRHGLLWIGEKFYKTPQDFMREADLMGVSRKISAIPRGFVLGQTQLYFAHRKAFPVFANGESRMEPGVFTTFKPIGLDLVVNDIDHVPEAAERLAERIEKAANEAVVNGGTPAATDCVRLVQVEREQQVELQDEEGPETAANHEAPE